MEGEDAVGMRGKPPAAGISYVEVPDVPYGKLKPGPGRSAAEVERHQSGRINRAMVDIVAEESYGGVTVRALAQRAAVSTRTFYKHYPSIEECFLRVHQLIVRRLIRNVAVAQVGVNAPRERLRLSTNAIMGEWSRDQRAARFMLVGAYAAGPMALKQVRCANRSIEAQVGASLANAAGVTTLPPLLVEGIVAGLVSTARSRLLREPGESLVDLGDGLAQWALSYCAPATVELEELGRIIGSLKPEAVFPGFTSSGEVVADGRVAISSDRSLLLAAAAKLAATAGREPLTLQAIAAAAGLPRRRFYAHFSGAEDCLLAALELYAGEAICRARQAGEKGLTPAGRVYQATTCLCTQVARDPTLAGLCFSEISATRGLEIGGQRELIADIGRLAEDGATGIAPISDLTIEASAGALWGVLQHEVMMGRAGRATQIAPTLAYFILAPTTGAFTAVEAMREEHQLAT